MVNTVNNVSQSHYQLEAQDQSREKMQKISEGKAGGQKDVSTGVSGAGGGQTDTVEISSKRSENVAAPKHAVPKSREEALALLEETKGRLQETAIQNPEQIHSLDPGALIDMFA